MSIIRNFFLFKLLKRMQEGGVLFCVVVCALFVGVESQIGLWDVESLSVPRYAISAASAGDYAIFAGGLNETANFNQVDFFHSKSRVINKNCCKILLISKFT
jgi:hypothetical protein